MKNKLGYLGFLGFVGIYGIFWRSFTHSAFLIFFFFFTYLDIIPDELFKENIKKSASNAFMVNMIISIVILGVCTTISNLYQYTEINGNMLFYGFVAFVLNFIISMLTFVFTLMHYAHKEKGLLE